MIKYGFWIAGVALWIYSPYAWFVVVLANALLWLSVQSIHIVAAISGPKKSSASTHKKALHPQPFISVHLAIYDEPPDVVIGTLAALRELDYAAFEVIVLDNNTPDPRTWAPVQAYCAKRPDKFKFFHFDNVKGAKAGALNICLDLSATETEFVAIIDADYVVERDFLSIAVDAIRGTDNSFVQFPQAYRNLTTSAAPIAAELEDYFNAFARRANATRSMLLTGTLSFISIKAIREVGRWNATTVTEDAELGVRLFNAGHQGVFVDRVVGRGLLPLDFAGLRTQRDRWAFGNLSTLLHSGILTKRSFRRDGRWSIVAQLTAWPGFWLLPAAVLIMGSLGVHPSWVRNATIEISAMTIFGSLFLGMVRMLITGRARGQQLGQSLLALLVKSALMWTTSLATARAVFMQTQLFVRTPKIASRLSADHWPNVPLATFGALSACAYLVTGNLAAACACALLAATLPAALWVDQRLRNYTRQLGGAPTVECA